MRLVLPLELPYDDVKLRLQKVMVDHLLDVEDDLRMVHHNEKVHPFQLQRLKLYSLHKNMRNEFNQDPDTNHQQILRHRQELC